MSTPDLSWMTGRFVKISFVEPAQWVFDLGESARVNVECPWRLLQKGKIKISSEDHNQKYGLPAPLDAGAEANKLLRDARVIIASVGHGTSDLKINCDGDLALEVIPFSSGYEAWHASSP